MNAMHAKFEPSKDKEEIFRLDQPSNNEGFEECKPSSFSLYGAPDKTDRSLINGKRSDDGLLLSIRPPDAYTRP